MRSKNNIKWQKMAKNATPYNLDQYIGDFTLF